MTAVVSKFNDPQTLQEEITRESTVELRLKKLNYYLDDEGMLIADGICRSKGACES